MASMIRSKVSILRLSRCPRIDSPTWYNGIWKPSGSSAKYYSPMRDAILSFGSQLTRGAALTSPLQIPFRKIIACGMGGSSVAGEILSLVHDEVVVHWDYDLPSTTAPQDVVVCSSWSGNTQETLSSYQEALQRKIPVAVITGGG